MKAASNGVSNLLGYANEGTKFLFGALATHPLGQNFAIGALPVIIFFASFISILYYIGVMQYVIRWIGGGLQKITGISKVESLCAGVEHLCRSVGISACHPSLSCGVESSAIVLRNDRGHGWGRGDDSCRLCLYGHPHRLSACCQLHVSTRRHIDGKNDDAR